MHHILSYESCTKIKSFNHIRNPILALHSGYLTTIQLPRSLYSTSLASFIHVKTLECHFISFIYVKDIQVPSHG